MARAATSPVSTPALPASERAGTITIDVAAKLLTVTPEWVRQLTKDGWIAKTNRGRYRVVDVVQGYIRFLKDEARRVTKTALTTGCKTRPAGGSHDTRKLGGELR